MSSNNKQIRRITLFKVPTEEGQEQLLDKYRTLQTDAKKDGKPYIVDIQAGKAIPDQRSQGFTLAIVSIFKTKEDMKYYDEQCEAHAALKKVAVSVKEGLPLMVYYESIHE